MRLPLKFYTLMVPFALSAFTFPSQFAEFFGLVEEQQVAKPENGRAPPQGSISGVVKVADSGDGHFRVSARIGARRVPFLVDTGASVVALTWETGRDLGLARPNDRPNVKLSTANGEIEATHVMVDRLDVEGLAVSNVEAVVMPKGALSVNLLGMSYLGKLKRWQVERQTLVLER